MSERTFLLIKPDGVQRGLLGEVISRIERKGLKITALKMIWMRREEAELLYAVHKEKKFYEGLIEYVTSSPVVAMVVEGNGAVEIVRRIVGATDGRIAEPGTIRGDFSTSIRKNIVHAADSKESAEREIRIFFTENEILNYSRIDEKWVSED